MKRHSNLKTPQKDEIADSVQAGENYSSVGRRFGISHTAVRKIYFKRLENGDTSRKPGSGRKPKTSKKENRMIVRLSKSDPKLTASDIHRQVDGKFAQPVSPKTIQRRLIDAGLHGKRPTKKPLISKVNRKKRREFARAHLNWTANDWGRVFWSDESPFELFSGDRVQYIRRPVGKKYDPRYQLPTVKHGGGRINVWVFLGMGLVLFSESTES